MHNILYCVLIGCLAAAILCLLFSLYLTNKNFHQIERLLNILWRAEKDDQRIEGTPASDQPAFFFNTLQSIDMEIVKNEGRDPVLQRIYGKPEVPSSGADHALVGL